MKFGSLAGVTGKKEALDKWKATNLYPSRDRKDSQETTEIKSTSR